MAKLLSDETYALHGKLVAVDNSTLVGPLIRLRLPPSTADVQRPGSYIDFLLLDTHRKTRQVKLNAWVTFWPVPPTHGIILGKV